MADSADPSIESILCAPGHRDRWAWLAAMLGTYNIRTVGLPIAKRGREDDARIARYSLFGPQTQVDGEMAVVAMRAQRGVGRRIGNGVMRVLDGETVECIIINIKRK